MRTLLALSFLSLAACGDDASTMTNQEARDILSLAYCEATLCHVDDRSLIPQCAARMTAIECTDGVCTGDWPDTRITLFDRCVAALELQAALCADWRTMPIECAGMFDGFGRGPTD
jgi:hypothetical protein